MKETIVISLGGSTINNKGESNIETIKTFRKVLESKTEYKFGVVTGGGIVARWYAEGVRKFGIGEFNADETAVIATRLNAKFLSSILPDASPTVPEEFDEAHKLIKTFRIVAMGGTVPGITTDTDSVLLAESIGAVRLINVSSVDAIYDKNPKNHPDAKPLTEMTHAQLFELAARSDQRKAGTNFVFDLVACKLAERSNLELHFVGSSNIERDLPLAIDGKKHSGTIVRN